MQIPLFGKLAGVIRWNSIISRCRTGWRIEGGLHFIDGVKHFTFTILLVLGGNRDKVEYVPALMSFQ